MKIEEWVRSVEELLFWTLFFSILVGGRALPLPRSQVKSLEEVSDVGIPVPRSELQGSASR